METMVQVEILRVIKSINQNNNDKALVHMILALEYAVREELLHYFMFDIEITKTILEKAYQVQATTKTTVPKAFLTKLKTAISKRFNRIKLTHNFELSNRELEILKLMRENTSNKGIAESLYISINTVKTHVKNIYIKLEVNNRYDALKKVKAHQVN